MSGKPPAIPGGPTVKKEIAPPAAGVAPALQAPPAAHAGQGPAPPAPPALPALPAPPAGHANPGPAPPAPPPPLAHRPAAPPLSHDPMPALPARIAPILARHLTVWLAHDVATYARRYARVDHDAPGGGTDADVNFSVTTAAGVAGDASTIDVITKHSALVGDALEKAAGRRVERDPDAPGAFPSKFCIPSITDIDAPAWEPISDLMSVIDTELGSLLKACPPAAGDEAAASKDLADFICPLALRVAWAVPRVFDPAADPGLVEFYISIAFFEEAVLPSWMVRADAVRARAALNVARAALDEVCHRRMEYNAGVLACLTWRREQAVAAAVAAQCTEERVWDTGRLATSGWALNNPNAAYKLPIACAAGVYALLAGRACTFEETLVGLKAVGMIAEADERVKTLKAFSDNIIHGWANYSGPYWVSLVPSSASVSGLAFIVSGLLSVAVQEAQYVAAMCKLPGVSTKRDKIYHSIWSFYAAGEVAVGRPISLERVYCRLNDNHGKADADQLLYRTPGVFKKEIKKMVDEVANAGNKRAHLCGLEVVDHHGRAEYTAEVDDPSRRAVVRGKEYVKMTHPAIMDFGGAPATKDGTVARAAAAQAQQDRAVAVVLAGCNAAFHAKQAARAGGGGRA